jgi:methylase of polypeptide subunit release factors
VIEPSNFHATPKQAERLNERRAAGTLEIEIGGQTIAVDPGVYQTAGDTALMIESVAIGPDETFLEIGCGSGAVSVALAARAGSGVGVDVNELAVENSKKNAHRLGVSSVTFLRSDLFEEVGERFDVVVCNPPYTNHAARDAVDRMFWDPEDGMKRRFFREVSSHLKPGGRVYFGWADFADIDVNLPLRLAEESVFRLGRTFTKPHKTDFTFYVFEFLPAAPRDK